MKEEYRLVTEVQRFLGTCTFYHIWILHYAHIVEPLYGLLKKSRKFKWSNEHMEAIRRLKEKLTAAPALQKVAYKKGTLVFMTVDTSPARIGWVINHDDKAGTRFLIWTAVD